MAQRKKNVVRNVSSKRSKITEKPIKLEGRNPARTRSTRTTANATSGRKRKA